MSVFVNDYKILVNIQLMRFNLSVDFEEMCRAFEKARKVIDKEGACPRFYIRYLAELDDFVNEVCTFSYFVYCLT